MGDVYDKDVCIVYYLGNWVLRVYKNQQAGMKSLMKVYNLILNI